MAEPQPSQAEMLEQQKQNCPFCQIIAGNIPANKVYEDDQIVAILDINPAAKGHILVVPKEHFQLLAICPPELFTHMFKKAKELSKAVEEGVLSQGTELLIQSGAAAGQQSSHFMLHIIPREPSDGISAFDLESKSFPEETLKQVREAVSKNLNIALGRRFGKIKPQKIDKAQLLQIIEQNQQLKQVILEDPDELRKAIPTNQQLKALFADVDVEEIIAEVRGEKVEAKPEPQDNEVEQSNEEKDSKEESQEENNNTEEEETDSDSNDKPDLDDISSLL
jgi:histidine triad (HIT) family protein